MENSNKICPRCNTPNDPGNNECLDCGYVFTDAETPYDEEGVHKKRRPILSMILQLLTPGLGHLYNGQLKKAIIIFLIYSFGIIFLFLGGCPIQLY
jgi:hypothetical protein